MDTTSILNPDSYAISKQLLQLSKKPENRPFIAAEKGCLAGLISYVSHDDVDVVLMSTRTIQFLSSHPKNKKSMRENRELIAALTAVYSNEESHRRAVEFTGDALENLGVAISYSALNDENNRATQAARCAKNTKPFHTICVQLSGVDARMRRTLERALVEVDGVISVTVDEDKQRALVGTRRGDEIHAELKKAIQLAGADSELDASTASSSTSVSDDDSGYLDVKDYDEEEKGDRAVARWGVSTLEDRLDEQRKAEEMRLAERSERLISQVSGALSSAGSWLMGW